MLQWSKHNILFFLLLGLFSLKAQVDYCSQLNKDLSQIDGLLSRNLDSAYTLFSEFSINDLSACPKLEIKALEIRGVIEDRYGNKDQSRNIYHDIINLLKQENEDSLVAVYINRIGISFENSEAFDSALVYYNQAIDVYKDLKDLKGQADVNNNKGNLYSYIGFQDTSLRYYALSLTQYKKLGDDDGTARVFNNLASHYYDLGQFQEALIYQDSALVFFEKIKFNKGILLVLSNYAQILDQIHGCGGGEAYYLKAVEFTEQWASPYDKGVALISYIESLMCAQKTAGIKELFSDAKGYVEKSKSGRLELRLLKAEEHFYELQHQYQKAYELAQKHNYLKDSLDQLKQGTLIEQWKTKSNLDQKLRENELLQIEIKQQNQKSFFYKLAFAFLVILLILLFYIILQNKKLASKKALLLQRQNEIAEKDRIKLKADLQNKDELNRLLEEKYEKDIEFAKKELYTNTLHIISKNELLKKIEKSVNSILKTFPKEIESNKALFNEVKILKQDVKTNLSAEGDWEEFKLRFNEVNKDFFSKIEDLHPDLTKNDLRMCAYLLMGFKSKDLERILNISPDGIKKQRSRLRKRLNLEVEIDLLTYLKSI